ncbi:MULTISPECIES: hypothetical protein [unclassified Mycobacterium]|uniref:hypothetical protein n=1 Tax=unclassified Mycobacterium TaxID=2642494 RepID=UPI0029C86153|nr:MULTISPECIES: hypothetical protein [unclassified Mycobacterium]
MIETLTCHTLTCDECHQTLNPGDEGDLHFSDADEARNDATRYFDWTRDGDRDLCPECTARATCEREGHKPVTEDFGGIYCERCDEALTAPSTVNPKGSYL